MPLPEFWQAYKNSSVHKTPLFRNPEEPAKVIAGILFYKKQLSLRKNVKKEYSALLKNFNLGSINETGILDTKQTGKLARKYKLPLPKSKSVSPKDINGFNAIDFPLVIKGISKSFTHKSDFDAVRLNIKNKSELRKAVSEISKSLKTNNLEAEEFLVQEYINPKHELLIGGFRDNSFGPIIMFGAGGKYVDFFKDTSIRSAFITEQEIIEMILETRIGKIISGVRGEKGADLVKLSKIILNAARMIIENKNLVEFDINPLIINENGRFTAVDIRIKTELHK